MADVLDPTDRDEAIALIDASLGGLTTRKLVSSDEVTDLLLDMRAILLPSGVITTTDS